MDVRLRLPYETYTSVDNMRTLAKMRNCVKMKDIDKVKGCIRVPLIDIEPIHCVVDELHLLRITDVLIENLFAELYRLDHKDKTHRTGTGDRVVKATRKIRSFGITFDVWLAEEVTGKERTRSGLKTTALNRNERLKMFKSLPEYFDELLPNNVAVLLAKLWVEFLTLYKYLSSACPDAETVDKNAKKWVEDFVSLNKLLDGHQRKNVTPYMHILAYHVPDQIRLHGSIRNFSGQG